jgi:hypothetical protein
MSFVVRVEPHTRKLGVKFVETEKGKPKGVEIKELKQNSPLAGQVECGDVLLAVNGEDVQKKTLKEVRATIAAMACETDAANKPCIFTFARETVNGYSSYPTAMATRISMVWTNGQDYLPMPGNKFPSVLPKAKKDGEAMATFLTENGFEILSGQAMCEQNRDQMMDSAATFVDAVRKRKPEVALLYYSGHGLEDSEKNLIMGSLPSILVDELAGSETVLVFIFDCCRQLKSEAVLKGELSTQTTQAGKGMVFANMNTIALFGDGAGQLASDSDDATECSALTQAFLDTAKNMDTATEEALSFFGRVNETTKGLGAHAELITNGNPRFKFQSAELANAPADSFKIKVRTLDASRVYPP